MQRLSPKRQSRVPDEREFRQELIALVNGRCEWCGEPGTDQHELCRGALRHLARCCWFAVLFLCRACHRVLDEQLASDEAQKCGLAILRRSRPDCYDLAAFNRLVNERAPNRITPLEIEKWTYRLSLKALTP